MGDPKVRNLSAPYSWLDGPVKFPKYGGEFNRVPQARDWDHLNSFEGVWVQTAVITAQVRGIGAGTGVR